MKKIFLLLLICISTTMLTPKINYCQIIPINNWQLQSIGLPMKAIKFVDENTGWCCGLWGDVIKTTNGGTTWFSGFDSVNTNWTFSDICFINNNTGFISGSYAGIILKTTNCGNNWAITNLSNSVYQITFLNTNTGFAASNNGLIYKTTNMGISWSGINTGTTYSFKSINFVDFNIGFITGEIPNTYNSGIILKTTNGGDNWQEILYDTAGRGMIISFFNTQTGYAGMGNKILKTTNQGLNWANIHTMDGWISNIQFLNTSTGYASTGFYSNLFGTVAKTTNGGETWNIIISTQGGYVHFINPNTGFTASNDIGKHGIKKTIDGGNTWSTKIEGSEYAYVSMDFSNQDKGWLLSQRTINTTTDGGVTWNFGLDNSSETYTSVGFLNINTGWILGGTSSELMAPFFKTTNGGNNWSNNWHDFKWYTNIYKNDSNLYVLYESSNYYYVSYIMKSDNYGNLNTIFNLSGTILYGLDFINKNTGFTVGSNSVILKTTNSGQTWNAQTSPSVQNNYAVYFTDSLKGWVVGERENFTYGDVLRTTNGGSNWTVQLQTNKYLKDIKFINKNTGWIVGGRGTILYTTNGGDNWNYYPKFTGFDFERIYFKDNKTGWFLGRYGFLIKTENCGGLVSVSNISTETPSNYSLSQNYPNPFNPTTKIRFSIVNGFPIGAFGNDKVVLNVYDVMGREVQTLVNEYMKPGTYEATFDGSKLTSGVYFYRISTGDFTETRKMLLLK